MKLKFIFMSTNLENRERETQRKRESRRQASEAQREKSNRELQQEIKNKGIGTTTWKCCSGGEKMRNATGHHGENERHWKKVNKNTFDISSINWVTTKFLEVLRCRRANNGKNWTKKVCCTCKVSFLIIRPIVVFSEFSFPSPLSITRFNFFLNKP